MNKESKAAVAAGGVCFALMLALAIAAIGSQTFYPREGTVGMWCAIGLMMRVHVSLQNQKSSAALAAKTSMPVESKD